MAFTSQEDVAVAGLKALDTLILADPERVLSATLGKSQETLVAALVRVMIDGKVSTAIRRLAVGALCLPLLAAAPASSN